jgi:hypothetical protein
MGERTPKTLLEGGSFFEGPRWRDRRWFVSDFYNERVLAVLELAILHEVPLAG